MTYLEQGCPLVVAVEPESELAMDATRHGYGYCVKFGDSQELAELLDRLANDRGLYAEMKISALRRSEEIFSEKNILKKWSQMISEH